MLAVPSVVARALACASEDNANDSGLAGAGPGIAGFDTATGGSVATGGALGHLPSPLGDFNPTFCLLHVPPQ